MSTGSPEERTTASVILPSNSLRNPDRPCEAIMTMSSGESRMYSTIAGAAGPINRVVLTWIPLALMLLAAVSKYRSQVSLISSFKLD